MQAFEIYTTDPSASSRGPAVKDSDPYVPLDYELLVRGEAEESPRVVYDTYSFGMTVPQYNLELFQSGEVHTVRFDFWVDFLLRSFDTDSCCMWQRYKRSIIRNRRRHTHYNRFSVRAFDDNG